MQTGDRIEQAKVFKAHAVPQGLCANLINALKLLANQQEDGDDCEGTGQGEQKRSHGVNSWRLTMNAPLMLDP